ncbi:hypothetical protein B0H10DRAFT_1904277 [Mycena sp. CBHHK59/15]|nr:hypothetical protein B0H10DRAFT_1904277 [Mycena sp. CBHHK59/15]
MSTPFPAALVLIRWNLLLSTAFSSYKGSLHPVFCIFLRPAMEVESSPSCRVSESYRWIELGFDQLKNEVLEYMSQELASQKTIRKLESELNVYKLALAGLEEKCNRLQKLQDEREAQALKHQAKAHRVITLIDGDGVLFSADLISQGQQGGQLAACKLSDSILQHLTVLHGVGSYQLWVYMFYNKRGLTDTFGRVGLGSLAHNFDDFVLGFNQATERFIMVDVGSTKEAADAKLKVHLEDDIRLPQTFKIVFGGCHDNGYVANLRSQITAGFRDKLILLKGYTQMATAIAALDLPTLAISELFMTQKLPTGPRWMTTPQAAIQSANDTDTISNQQAKTPSESDEVDIKGASYSRVLQRAAAPGFRENSPPTEASGEGSCSSAHTGTRHINPQFVEWRAYYNRKPTDAAHLISAFSPPPCTLFYLSNCKHGTQCKYAHDYLLNEEHFQEMRSNALLAPCPIINRGFCTWGDACCYGHFCPLSPKCHFFKVGTCKFKGGAFPG